MTVQILKIAILTTAGLNKEKSVFETTLTANNKTAKINSCWRNKYFGELKQKNDVFCIVKEVKVYLQKIIVYVFWAG